MTITRLDVGNRMSSIVIHNNTVYLCGQVAKDKHSDITTQTITMLEEVDGLLVQAGSRRDNILSATIYLKDMGDYDAMNLVWDNWVPTGHAPARACVQAAIAEPEYLVEVSIVAAITPAG
ncbi:RidA family protein [Shewanella ulleungensis]|jgi:enamine deaminase RidA (YjgF/YER057c/UK114 family)|uniref:RidA family protein n=1 Tax=Shewanella ulleungensis TaxID=2282699 RepID=UPI00166996DF|nr:RidA family protein [Shewanella ulleungensis]MCL1152304.1 RidA family protein [Shewanella ulleungensis]